jgi:hypothetical protein
LASQLSKQGLFPRPAHPEDKPGQEYRQYGYVKDLSLAKSPEHWFVSTEKPEAEVNDGKNAEKKEKKAAFRFEFSSKPPYCSKDYQIAQ